jgi:hypothetical protein
VIDEITESGPNVAYEIRTESLGLVPRIARDGFMGLVGNPARLYPGLDIGTVDISWTVSAPGYLRRERAITLGPVPGFPNDFIPADEGVLLLHRQPFVFRGRAVKLVPGLLNPQPVLPPTTIAITGVWWTFPPADQDPVPLMKPANMVSLHPGLHADRTAPTDRLRRITLTAVPGQDKTMALPTVRGQNTARISNRIGVAPGTILAFEPSRPDRVEYVVVASVVGASTDDQPATATLAHRLQLDHEEGTDVQVVATSAPAAFNALDREGIPSDRVAFLAGMSGITAGTVEISGTGDPEYQTASLYSTTNDLDGYYRLPPLSRVASVQLETPVVKLVISPDYGRYENLVDLVHP